MKTHSPAAVAALALSAALAACAPSSEPATTPTSGSAVGGGAEPAAEDAAYTPAPRLGSASAALQTGVSTSALILAPQRPAPVPPPPATGPSLAPLHAPSPGAPGPLIPEPEADPAPAPAAAPTPAASAPPPAPAPAPAAPAEPASLSAEEIAEGRQLFTAYSCGACHVLADAGGTGHVGPAFDGNENLTREYAIGVIANGRGAMPGFAGQLTEEQIALLAAYIVEARK